MASENFSQPTRMENSEKSMAHEGLAVDDIPEPMFPGMMDHVIKDAGRCALLLC